MGDFRKENDWIRYISVNSTVKRQLSSYQLWSH